MVSAVDQKLSTDNFLRHNKYLILHFMRPLYRCISHHQGAV